MYENPQNKIMFLGVKTRKDTFLNSIDFCFRGQKRIKIFKILQNYKNFTHATQPVIAKYHVFLRYDGYFTTDICVLNLIHSCRISDFTLQIYRNICNIHQNHHIFGTLFGPLNPFGSKAQAPNDFDDFQKT